MQLNTFPFLSKLLMKVNTSARICKKILPKRVYFVHIIKVEGFIILFSHHHFRCHCTSIYVYIKILYTRYIFVILKISWLHTEKYSLCQLLVLMMSQVNPQLGSWIVTTTNILKHKDSIQCGNYETFIFNSHGALRKNVSLPIKTDFLEISYLPSSFNR